MLPVYKKYLLLLLFCFSLGSIAMAKDVPQYAVDKIPAELLKNANAVIRTNNVVFEVFSSTKGKETNSYVVTILKEGAIDMSVLSLSYDKLFGISNIEGAIYDANGERVRKIKNDEIKDYSAINGSTLFTDNRIKYIDPEYYTYPFTIEYSYTKEYNTLFFMPQWMGFEGYNVSIEQSSLTAISPSDYKLRILESKIESTDSRTEDGKNKYYWEVNNVKALTSEPFTPFAEDIFPSVKIAPTEFELDGINGSLNTWNDIGVFMGKLIKDLDELPIETQQEIQQLVKSTESKEEKIKTIYKYSQDKNRYISIQEGVGGWQPFPAETVDRLSYGDCKALSNYTKALLKSIGIESYYSRIYAGSTPYSAPKDFSMNAFNHVILCVPCDKDTIWLECTSSQSPAGYMGSFTDDRYALIVKENGGEFVKTPAYTAEENRQTTTSTIVFKDNLLLDINAQIKYFGANYDDVSHLLVRDEKDRRKSIINNIAIPNFKLLDYQLTVNKCRKPSLTKDLQLEASNYCTQMGSRTILKLNLFNALNSVPQYARKRNNPVYIRRNYSESDTIKYQIPEGLEIEALPEKTTISSKYGEYQSFAEQKDGHIIYHRYFQVNKGTYPKEEFNDFREFLEKVSVSDNAKTVLITKT